MELINYSPKDLSKSQIVSINTLTENTWPENATQSSEEEKVNEFRARFPKKTCHCVFEGKELIGYAESFPIHIKIVNKEADVMGIGAVCVNPEYRGKGLGALLVNSAFSRVDNNEYPLCIFQTGVSHFYLKLGCKIITNKIINSRNAEAPNANPFWDEYTMIYPTTFLWPSGIIDLLGPGF